MEPFEIMVSESQERMLAVVEPAERRRGARRLREAGRPARRRSARSPTAAACASCDGDEVVGEMPVDGARRRLPALRPGAGGARGLDLRQRGDARLRAPSATPTRRIARWRCSPRPNIASKRWAFEQYDSIVGSRTVRRPESADAAVLDAARGRHARSRVSIDGNGRRVACDPYAGHGRGGARVRAKPRLRRRRAARADQLPQLRQPREAARRLAARPLDPGPRRRVRGARRSRSSAATSRSTTRPTRARSTRRRSSAWSASCPIRERAGGIALARRRRDRAGRPVRSLARRLGAGEAARRARAGLPAIADRRGRARRSHSSARPSAPAQLDGAHDVSDGGLAVRAGGDGDRRRRRRRGRPRRSGRAARLLGRDGAVRRGAGRLRRRRADAARRSTAGEAGRRRRVSRSGRRVATRIELSAAEAEVSVLLADAERAWRSLGQRMTV